ncbi:transposase [uncultured Cyclobacterium sp.]|tara:strand:- start:10119 stop:10508 length:390 start_codon:yes stop_codon:yes gene_type:complete
MWVYIAPAEKLVLFDYQKGRDRSGPKVVLAGYSAVIQTDGFWGYESLYSNHAQVMLEYRMAHGRRKLLGDAQSCAELMSQLYKLEQSMRDESLPWGNAQSGGSKRLSQCSTKLKSGRKGMSKPFCPAAR